MKNSSPSFIAIDLFCGAGGTTRGLLDAGGFVAAGVDNHAECAETYEKNNINIDGSCAKFIKRNVFQRSEQNPNGEQDILISEIEDILRPLKELYPEAPILFSICAPCQPFSSLARGELTKEKSNDRLRDRDLLEQSLNLVSHFNPELIFCENVAGIQNPKYGGAWDNFTNKIKELGYKTGSSVVNAANFSVPQSRKRSIMLSVHSSCLNEANYNLYDDCNNIIIPECDGTNKQVNAIDVIKHFPPLEAGEVHSDIKNHRCSKLSDLNKKRISILAPGERNLTFQESDLELECHTRLRKSKKHKAGFSDSYTRMAKNKPAPTITTKCLSFSNGRFGHPDIKQNRAISIREAAALQSFPDEYEFYSNSILKTAKMVGNAVPPLLAKFFALELIKMYRQPS